MSGFYGYNGPISLKSQHFYLMISIVDNFGLGDIVYYGEIDDLNLCFVLFGNELVNRLNFSR